jgi:hypothetical protein
MAWLAQQAREAAQATWEALGALDAAAHRQMVIYKLQRREGILFRPNASTNAEILDNSRYSDVSRAVIRLFNGEDGGNDGWKMGLGELVKNLEVGTVPEPAPEPAGEPEEVIPEAVRQRMVQRGLLPPTPAGDPFLRA